MPVKILMPALSPTMEHGHLAKWIKKEGDTISAGDVIAEVETDKATMEVEAVDEGVLAKIVVSEGAKEVPVNSLIAVILEEGESSQRLDEFVKSSTIEVSSTEDRQKDEEEIDKKKIEVQISSDESKAKIKKSDKIIDIKASLHGDNSFSQKEDRIFASPLARRIALQEEINLSNINGTGPHGRIIKADVLSAIKNTAKNLVLRNPREYTTITSNNIRQIIAKRLVESKTTVPHFYLSMECVMDNVIEARTQLNASFGNDKDKKLSINDFVIMASSKALRDVPEVNSSWSEDAIIRYNNVDISVAVAIQDGLITPIIRNADQKGIIEISSEMKNLAKRARDNDLKPEEFHGGGFTISNLGMYGVKNFNAIINPPQSCILSVGMSSKRPSVIDDKIEIRTIMDVSLSCDHRVVDGAVGAKFLSAFKKNIESAILMFV